MVNIFEKREVLLRSIREIANCDIEGSTSMKLFALLEESRLKFFFSVAPREERGVLVKRKQTCVNGYSHTLYINVNSSKRIEKVSHAEGGIPP